MEADKADPDTQRDVDIMILDYLICIRIKVMLCGRTARRPEDQIQSQDDWAFNSIYHFRSILQQEHTLPQDLRIKLQLLDFADIFFPCYTQRLSRRASARGDNNETTDVPTITSDDLQQQPSFVPTLGRETPSANTHSSWIIPHFMVLCTMAKEKVSVTRWVDIVARFTMQAAVDQFYQHGSGSSELLDRCLSWKPEDRYQTAILEESNAKCHLQIQTCASLETYLDTISNTRSLSRLEGIVCEFLSDLMEVLDPPVLLQLERGQLGKLNREETEQLKSRIGFR